MLKFHCHNCDAKIGVPDAHMGRKVKCPVCAQAVSVPVVERDGEAQLVGAAVQEASAHADWGSTGGGSEPSPQEPLADLMEASTAPQTAFGRIEAHRVARARRNVSIAAVLGLVIGAVVVVAINEAIGLPRVSHRFTVAPSPAPAAAAEGDATPAPTPTLARTPVVAMPPQPTVEVGTYPKDWRAHLNAVSELITHYRYDAALAALAQLRTETDDPHRQADIDRWVEVVQRALHGHNNVLFGAPGNQN